MPPARGRKTIISHLTEQEILDLSQRFEIHRKNINCSQCQTINSLHRNGTQTGNPPQPSFICKRCSKTHNARTVYEILNRMETASQEVEELPVETSGSFDINNDTDNLRQLITQLREELKRTQLELQQARSEITQLRERQHLPTVDSLSQPHQASMHTSNPSTLPPWRDTARIQQLKQSLTTRGEQRRAQQQETSARFLRPPSNNQGFQYIYIPTKARIPVGQLRTHLRRLEINNSRILDIHYPARNLAALLVHNDYATELKDHLQRFKVSTRDDFDPCSGTTLLDPKYTNNTPEERDSFAFMHHCDRMKRALNHIRQPVKAAVARFFYQRNWITLQDLKEALPSTQSQSTHPFVTDEDMGSQQDMPLDDSIELQ